MLQVILVTYENVPFRMMEMQTKEYKTVQKATTNVTEWTNRKTYRMNNQPSTYFVCWSYKYGTCVNNTINVVYHYYCINIKYFL